MTSRASILADHAARLERERARSSDPKRAAVARASIERLTWADRAVGDFLEPAELPERAELAGVFWCPTCHDKTAARIRRVDGIAGAGPLVFVQCVFCGAPLEGSAWHANPQVRMGEMEPIEAAWRAAERDDLLHRILSGALTPDEQAEIDRLVVARERRRQLDLVRRSDGRRGARPAPMNPGFGYTAAERSFYNGLGLR